MKQVQLTICQAIEGYLLERRIELKPSTIKNYGYAFRKFRGYFPDDPFLNTITPRQITDLLAYYGEDPIVPDGAVHRPAKPLSRKSLLNLHAVLSSLWTWATREGYADEHIMHRVPAPEPEQRAVVPYTRDDIQAMLDACDYSFPYTRPGKRQCTNSRPTALRDRAIVYLLLDTGIRASELCNLCVKHLDTNNRRIKVYGKGSKERLIRIGSRALKVLWRYGASRPDSQPGDPLFCSARDDDQPMSRSALYRMVRALGRRAGITPSAYPHRFRHTFAINFLRNGGDVYSLQTLLGHTTLEMVKRYLAIAQTDTEAAHRRASPVDNWRL